MLIILVILKIIFLFLAVQWTIVNVGKVIANNNIASGNIIMQAVGIVGFVVLQFNMFQ